MDKRIGIMLPIADYEEVLYASREAQIRFKRARAEFRNGNEAYSHWDEDLLNHELAQYTKLEEKLTRLYQEATGEDW